MDAYYSTTMAEPAADRAAAALYPVLFKPSEDDNHWNPNRTELQGATQYQKISDGRGGERITFQYITPIPAIDADPRFNSPARFNDTAHEAGFRVTGVTFEPKK
jgi:hypothetical protein